MIELEKPIEDEYRRALAELSSIPNSDFEHGLSAKDVLRAHFLIANHFYLEGEGLGGVGPRSMQLLLSAVDRQYCSFDGEAKWGDRFDICATLFFGLIKNHPFHDANKRTAFLSVLFLMYRFGWCPSANEKVFEDFTVEISDNLLSKYARFKAMQKAGELDPEIKYISWFLKHNARQIDRAQYSVTYRELKVILNRYGYDFSHPSGNHINIVRLEQRRRLFGLAAPKEVEVRICQIGFPRWTAEVGKAALKTVRHATKLSSNDGVDSAAFFKGLDPMQSLIATYNRPLMNLANR